MKTRKAIPAKTRALLQQEIGSACPFCTSHEVDHFHVHHIDENPENGDFGNLLMICTTCHSKITKGDISVHEVRRKKMLLRNRLPTSVIPMPVRKTMIFGNVSHSVFGDNNRVTVEVKNQTKQKYSPGCIGLPLERFDELSRFIQRRIDGTKLARMKATKGRAKFYSSYDEYLAEQN